MKHIILFVLLISFFACKEHTSSNTELVDSTQSTHLESIIENETDPICDMSVREHVSDTALINGKVWGFCSPVCKEKYLQAQIQNK